MQPLLIRWRVRLGFAANPKLSTFFLRILQSMDVERIVMFAGIGFALAIGAFVLWGPTPRPRRRGQVAGITNLGYTCFLNSLLQSLAACPTFLSWLHRQRKKCEKSCFTNSLVSVLEKVNGLSDDLYGDVTPIVIITSLGPAWSFAPGHQDAHELLHVVLSALQAETQPVNRKGCLSDALPEGNNDISDMKGSGDPLGLRSASCNDIAAAEDQSKTLKTVNDSPLDQMQVVSTQSIQLVLTPNKPGMILARSSEIISKSYGLREIENGSFRPWSSLCAIPLPNISALSNDAHPFSGLLTSQLQCTNCNWKSSVHYDKLESISLPLPPAGAALTWRRHTLAELLSRLVTSEVIHDVQCDGCASRCPAIKTLTLGKLPRCLCLHIPRTTWSPTGMPIKRDDPVIFPELLVLDPFTFTEAKKRNTQGDPQVMVGLSSQNSAEGKHRYRLRSVVEHRGPVDAGHFVSYRRGNKPGEWIYASDTTIERTALANVMCASPYLLFYERLTGTQD